MKTLILGLGNPILSDDGVGIHVARELEKRTYRPDVTVLEASLAGLGLLDLIAGYDRVILIDSIKTMGGKAGQIYCLEPDIFDTTLHAASPHDVNFATALELGRRLNIKLPQQITIFAIEAEDISTFSEECTPDVGRAIPACAEMVIQNLNGGYNA